MHDKRRIAFLLTFVGGFLEIYSYLYMDAFATTITGNIVLLTYHLRKFSWDIVIKYFLPIMSFILGVITVELLKKRIEHISNFFWRKAMLKLEIIAILIIPFVTNVRFSIMLIAYISAIQLQSFKTVYGITYMSTMSTGNVRNFFESLINKKYDNTKSYAIVIIGFLLGIIIGDISIIYLGKFAIYFCILVLLLCMFMLGKNYDIRK